MCNPISRSHSYQRIFNMNTTILDNLFSKIDTYKKYIIQTQKELTAIPALGPENKGDGEKNKSDYIKHIINNLKLMSHGIPVQLI